MTSIRRHFDLNVPTGLEQVQRRAARFTTGDYHTTSSVTAMLAELEWKRLEDRRKDLRLALLYKIVHGHVAVPVDALNLEPPDPRTRKKHKYTYKHLTPHTDPYKHFFLCRIIPEWNSLPARAVEATSVESFKTHLAGRPQRDQPWSGTPTHPRHTPEEDCGSLYQTRPDQCQRSHAHGFSLYNPLVLVFHEEGIPCTYTITEWDTLLLWGGSTIYVNLIMAPSLWHVSLQAAFTHRGL